MDAACEGACQDQVAVNVRMQGPCDGTYRLDDVVDQLLCLVDLFFRVGHDEAVQVFILVAGVSRVRLAFALLDGTLAADGDLGR